MDHRSAEVKSFIKKYLSIDCAGLEGFLNKVALFEEKSVSLAMTACQTVLKEKKSIREYFQAIKLVRESIEVNNRLILKYVKHCILKYFIEIAQFQKESSNDLRG